MHHFFYKTYLFFAKNKALGLLSALLFLVFCGYLGSRISFDENVMRILPKNEQAQLTTKVVQQLNFSDKITVLIEKDANATLDAALLLAQKFYDTIRTDSVYIENVQGFIDQEVVEETYQFVQQNLPLFLTDQDYEQLAFKVHSDSLKNQVQQNFNTLLSPNGFVASRYIQNDPLGLAFVGLKNLQNQSAGSQFIVQNGFVTSADSTQILLFITPKKVLKTPRLIHNL
ncbi:hypothetical protein K5I29_10860 [Flavobacterium agricola]|uniref:AcrB/AcrD/AcrF family protein n=1 Tax=Flavobacterium agricola TaxID=2870839 RepID=A0ABY6M0P5_9FLAO|nr:hypothetical protein [Flavobacterium agricola]UYW00985.1 hypothetical protein K5I29_10860 [Flavobacterium agricola]